MRLQDYSFGPILFSLLSDESDFVLNSSIDLLFDFIQIGPVSSYKNLLFIQLSPYLQESPSRPSIFSVILRTAPCPLSDLYYYFIHTKSDKYYLDD